MYVFLLVGNWAFIFLHLEGFFKKHSPKKQKANVPHYLTYPQPHYLFPRKKNMPKGLGRTPGHGAARTRGLESPADTARRMAIFGVE